MTNKKRAFIIKPLFHNLTLQNLKYPDVLTYITIKSFDNEYSECFPSRATISEKSGFSEWFVSKSIKRLENAKYLSVKRSPYNKILGKSASNRYYFKDDDIHFNQIPLEIFDAPDLSTNEKAILLLLREFQVSPSEIWGSIKEMADHLGLTEKTLDKQYRSLVKKGYLDKSRLNKKISNLLRIDWGYENYLKCFRDKLTKTSLLICK